MPSIFGKEKDLTFMGHALREAQKAGLRDEVPIGAIVISPQGKILGRGHNQVEKKHSQYAHAESMALAAAGKQSKDWRLTGSWVYVTVQPCAMCIALIRLSRCAGVIYGAQSPLFGYHLVDNETPHSLYKKDVMHIESGVAAHEAAMILKEFFKKKRGRK